MAMTDRHPSRPRRAPRPITPQRLEEMALAYVARFATSAAKLRSYLVRKVRERGWEGDTEPDFDAMVARYVRLGYIDDAAFARTKSGGLLRRGYGPRRVAEVLSAAGIAEDIRADVRADPAEERRSALALAARRRFGPFGGSVERDVREKQVAAMLRAGHGFDAVRAVIDAPSITAAEQWAAEAEEHQ